MPTHHKLIEQNYESLRLFRRRELAETASSSPAPSPIIAATVRRRHRGLGGPADVLVVTATIGGAANVEAVIERQHADPGFLSALRKISKSYKAPE